MIKQLIEWSVANRFLVLALTTILIALGIYQTLRMPIDAIPDLSDVQVIIQTDFPGQTPKLVEDQVTYPLTTIMSSVPYAKTVRGYSYFGVSFVYIIFEDGTDMYWARSRVLEYLNSATANLPELAKSRIGPDATGVGWVLQYSLTDSLNRHNLQELRSIQDWFLKFELQTVRGVSEIASIGGFVKQYQVDIDPLKLRTLNLSLADVIRQVKQSNQAIGARLIEQAESEFMVSAPAYISSIPDLEKIVIRSGDNGSQVVLADIATIHLGPELRRGVLEINGEGESVGGIAVMCYGENALRVIADLKTKMASLKSGLPEGVGIHIDYDRSLLINRAVSNVTWKLLEEMLLVAVITILFLLHFRSAMIAIISIPVGILISLICMNLLGLNANVMSLAGIGIAIGVMVDASIVMIENAHKRLAKLGDFTEQQRREIILLAAKEVGPALFFSLLIITISFLPVFTLEQVEGRLFKPLAYTKTFAMAASSVLAITLIPVLMSLFVRGKFRQESDHRVMKRINDWYRFLLKRCLNYPKTIVSVALFSLLISLYPLAQLGSEFMPALEEGDLLYMPTTLPGISITKAKEILQETDRIIAAFPEVERVIGKVGRAETATDPAPLSMLETVIRLKDESQWRAGMTIKKLVDQLDQAIQIPGLTNAWTMPIRTRIDMLATGIKTPIGIKIAGTDLRKLEEIGQQIEQITRQNPNTLSVYAERSYGGNYLTINLDRGELARYGFTIADVQTVIASAIGGMNIAYSVEGLERYPIQLRYPREYRDQVDVLSDITIRSSQGFHVPLKQLASFAYNEGPAMIKSEHSRPNAWVY
ncbi:MAG: efflux RND transporter permease subunit, partial [Leptospiraceae bacterium]|nr:efflux RND transporter permease subunit [Leptospiraceae bacterium]